MSIFRPFQGLRPIPAKAKAVASRPYDVLNSEEARTEAIGNPDSFLHVVKPEIDLPPDTNLYSEAVYEKGRENFEAMLTAGTFTEDASPCFLSLRIDHGWRKQTGIVGCLCVQDYFDNIILKHEPTRADKEEDRKKPYPVYRYECGTCLLYLPCERRN